MQKLHAEGRIWYPTHPDSSFDYTRRPQLKRYLKEQEGSIITNIWLDIQPLHSAAAERLGYPTQKPLALLERIIQASSNPGDLILDPFSGCGTAIAAAQKLNRRWIGIDTTSLAIAMHKARLKDHFNLLPGKDYAIIGEPQDLHSARQLAHDDRYQFQWWTLSLINARPVGSTGTKQGKKGSDKGIDGVISFLDSDGKVFKVLVQVKSGHVNVSNIRDLRGVLDREQDAPIGIFITLETPTSEMTKEAITAGYTQELWGKAYPRIQILTIENLLSSPDPTKLIDMPPTASNPFPIAPKVTRDADNQTKLFE